MTAKHANEDYLPITALVEALGMDEGKIKYYQSKNLVSPMRSKQNGHLFSTGDVARLRLISRAKDAGYSIGKIESLIGRISPHLSEAAKIKESVDFADKNFERIQREQAKSDVLEQINIACDLELLGGYLKELNALKIEPQAPNKKRQPVPDIPQQPTEDRGLPVFEMPVDAIPSITDVIGKKAPGTSKKYLFASVLLGLIAVVGVILLIYKPERVPEGNTLNIQAKDNGEEAVLSLSLASDANTIIPKSDDFSGKEGIVPDQTLENNPSPIAPKDDNLFQPSEPEAHAMGSEAARSELIDKLLSDMQSQYDSSTVATTAPKKDLSQTNGENDELKSVADVTASLALVQNAKKSTPSNTESSGNSQKNSSNKAAKTTPGEKPPLKASSPKKASVKNVEKEGAKVSAPQSSELKVAAIPEASKVESSKSPKPSSASVEKPAGSSQKGKAQPKQAIKDKPKQPQPPKQKATPVKKPGSKRPKAAALTSPIKKFENIDPAALDWAKKSRESFQKGDMSETIVSATVSISIEPGQVQPYIDRALAYKQKGLFEKAIADCNRAMVNDPGSAIAVYTRGVVYQAMGQKQNARLDYAKACVMGFVDACDIQTAQLEKESVDKLMKKSRESFRKGDWDAVILATTDALKQDPANVVAYVTRSAAYSQKKMFTYAISDCDAALKIDPGYALAYNNRGYARKQLKKTDEAIQDYEKACSLGLKLGCQNYEKF